MRPNALAMSTTNIEPSTAALIVAREPAALSVEQVEGFGARRQAAEHELAAKEIALPLPQRAEWQRAADLEDTVLLVVRDRDGEPIAAQSVGISISRALPGHRIYRVERFSAGSSPEVAVALVGALARLARNDSRCLRLIVETFDRDPTSRERLGRALRAAGFEQSPTQRMYRNTLALDLQRTEEEIFARLQSKARRDIKVPTKRGLELRRIVDPAFADTLRALSTEAFKRTQAQDEGRPWAEIIRLSAAHSDLSRVVGLFDPRTPGQDGLVAFAWGCCHGDCASYEAGGSVRRPELKSTPLGYAPLWDLIAWARAETTATWFDLGGVSDASASDPRSGIAEFKRYFSDDLVEVAGEWKLEPHPMRAMVASWVSGIATRMSRRVAAP